MYNSKVERCYYYRTQLISFDLHAKKRAITPVIVSLPRNMYEQRTGEILKYRATHIRFSAENNPIGRLYL